MVDPHSLLPWHRRASAGPIIRVGGLLLLLVAWRAGVALHGMAARPGAGAYGLALVAFLGASAGLAATLVGAHLFDQVPIASRWGQPPALDAVVADGGAEPATVRAAPHPSAGIRRQDRLRSASA